jgi:acyl-CoA synthetase (AMP-forming)/AMP-acid ligase II
MLCTPRHEFWIVFLACARIGAIWVGLNPRFREIECDHVLRDASPTLLLARVEDTDLQPWLASAKARHASLREVIHVGAAPQGEPTFEDFCTRARRVPAQALREAIAAVRPDDTAVLVYTSGSTGRPKGVELMHRGFCQGSEVQLAQFGLKHPRLVVSFPINHVACVGDCCAMILVGGGTILFQERLDPARVLDATAREKCNVLAGVPTMLQLLIAEQRARPRDLSSLELIAWGGAAMPAPQVAELARMGKRLVAVYGLTETTSNVTFTPPDASVTVLAETIGREPPDYPCRIVDAAGTPCPRHVPGELQFFGPYLMKGYWANPAATADAFTPDGWLRTGDVGVRRVDGAIRFVGRLKEMFKSGGYNIYPREIEAALEAHPEVAMAAVVAVPDPLYQEVGWAYVAPRAPRAGLEETLRQHCRAQLANYKVPKRVVIRDSLPVLPVGKIDKAALRIAALRELQLQDGERSHGATG